MSNVSYSLLICSQSYYYTFQLKVAANRSLGIKMSERGSIILTRSQHLKSNIIPKRSSQPGQQEINTTTCLYKAKEYAEAASLHGIKYISEDGRHPLERLL